MENVPRGSGGRRLFSPAFKREQVARLARGKATISELGRELGISTARLSERDWQIFRSLTAPSHTSCRSSGSRPGRWGVRPSVGSWRVRKPWRSP